MKFAEMPDDVQDAFIHQLNKKLTEIMTDHTSLIAIVSNMAGTKYEKKEGRMPEDMREWFDAINDIDASAAVTAQILITVATADINWVTMPASSTVQEVREVVEAAFEKPSGPLN